MFNNKTFQIVKSLKANAKFYQMRLRKDDNPREFLRFKLLVEIERTSAAANYPYCTICDHRLDGSKPTFICDSNFSVDSSPVIFCLND